MNRYFRSRRTTDARALVPCEVGSPSRLERGLRPGTRNPSVARVPSVARPAPSTALPAIRAATNGAARQFGPARAGIAARTADAPNTPERSWEFTLGTGKRSTNQLWFRVLRG